MLMSKAISNFYTKCPMILPKFFPGYFNFIVFFIIIHY